MQSSLAVKVVVKNYKGRVCYECRTELKPRAAPRGRYYCPNCSSPEDKTEGDGEYIITNEYYRGLLSPELEPRGIPSLASLICEYQVVPRRIVMKTKRRCEVDQKEITDDLMASFGTSPGAPRKYLHLYCAQGIGLKLSEEDEKEVTVPS